MSIQSCPRCGSNRIRRGYRRTPWWWAMFGRYNLLCNSCNWEFVGFAFPGTVTERGRKRRTESVSVDRRQLQSEQIQETPIAQIEQLGETINLNTIDNQTVVTENLSLPDKEQNLTANETDNESEKKADRTGDEAVKQSNSVDLNFKKKPAQRIKVKKRIRIKKQK